MNTIHYKYAIGILIALLIACLAVKLSGVEALVTVVSFASSISSLLLAFIAIIYAFFSNSSFISSVTKIETAAETVKTETIKLNSTMKEFDEIVRQIPDSMIKVENRILENSEAIKSAQIATYNYSTQIKPNDELIFRFIKYSSWYGLKSIYMCCLSHKYNITFNLEEICKIIQKLDYNYMYGYITATTSIGFLNIQADNGTIKTFDLIPDLESKIIDRIKELYLDGKIAPTDQMKAEIDDIENYFSNLKNSLPEQKS